MKTKILGLILFFLLIINCSQEGNFNLFYSYDNVYVGIQDMSGNDLIKGIEYYWWRYDEVPEPEWSKGLVKSDLYKLDIVYSVPKESFFLYYKNGDFELVVAKINDNYYLFFSEFTYTFQIINEHRKNYPPADKITYKLVCPYIFGNDSEHKIVTYWKQKSENKYNNECYRIEFDGKVLNPKPEYDKYEGQTMSAASSVIAIIER